MTTSGKQLLTVPRIKAFVSELPDFSGSSVEVVDGGVSTAVYRLRKNSEIFYLRLGDIGGNMSSEALAHEQMIEKGVSVPKVILCEDENPIINRSFMITTEIPGTRTDKDPRSSADVIVQAGRQLALINSIPVERFGWIDREVQNVKKLSGTFSSWEDFALNTADLESKLIKLAKINVFKQEIVESVMTHIEKNRKLISCPQAFLAHGDFDVSHIFSADGIYSGIIDFGDIRCCSPYHDLAHFYTYSRRQFGDLLRGFTEVTPLGDRPIEKILFEALLFGIGKLWYLAEHFPEKLTPHHPVISLILDAI